MIKKYCIVFTLLVMFMVSYNPGKIFSQIPKQDTKPTVSFETTVRLKLFDVLVLDSVGNPIRNIKKEQFQLFIDGEQVDIDTFDFIDFSFPEKEIDAQKSMPEAAGKQREAFKDSIEDKRLFIIIFHNLPWAQEARQEIAEGIYEFMEDNNSCKDYYALYYFSGPSIKLLLPFTNNPRLIKDAIDELYINNSAGFKPFMPGSGDWIKSVQSEFGSEGMIEIVSAGSTGKIDPKFSDHMSTDVMDAKTIHEMNVTLKNLDVLLRSFSLFKGRKEVFLFSDSISLKRYNQARGYLGRGKTGIDYDRVIQDARTNNITINAFKVVRRDPFLAAPGVKISTGLSPAAVDQQEGMQQQEESSRRNRLSRKLSNDLKIVAEETGGLYFDKASRKSAVTEGLQEAYRRSSYIYYLGIYLNNLEIDKNKEHSVKIEVADENTEIIYQTSFRLDPEYKKMNDSDRFSQFLDALFGVKKYDTLKVTDSLLHFPYGQNENLLISVLRMPFSKDAGNVFNFAVRYYNTAKMLDKQVLRTWDIRKNKEKLETGGARFIVGIPLDAGEYIYRYVVRDEENGTLKSAEYIINIDNSKRILSSPVVFGTSDIIASYTNLLDFNINKDQEKEIEPDFILDAELNPFIYNNKLFAPLIEESIIRNQDAYLMFMYNSSKISGNRYHLTWSFKSAEGHDLTHLLIRSEDEKVFTGGWRRVTLKLLVAEISLDIKGLKFLVMVKDQAEKEVESETLDIKLK